MRANYLMVNVEYLIYENKSRRASGHALNVRLMNVSLCWWKGAAPHVASGVFVPHIVSFPTKSVVTQRREIQSLNDTRIFVWRKFITSAMHREFRKKPKPLSTHEEVLNLSQPWPPFRMKEHPLSSLLLLLAS